jgi:hypothetical protein
MRAYDGRTRRTLPEAEQAMVLFEHLRIAGAESLEQPRRTLDIGKEEGDGARR